MKKNNLMLKNKFSTGLASTVGLFLFVKYLPGIWHVITILCYEKYRGGEVFFAPPVLILIALYLFIHAARFVYTLSLVAASVYVDMGKKILRKK